MVSRVKEWKESSSVTVASKTRTSARLLSSSLRLARRLLRPPAQCADGTCDEHTPQQQSLITPHGSKDDTGSDYFVCSKCYRPSVEMPQVVSFRVLKSIEGSDDVAAIWVPEVEALCDKCMDGVRSGEPIKRPDGEASRVGTEKKETGAIGFQAPEATDFCTCTT
jgi:hypothetical protein